MAIGIGFSSLVFLLGVYIHMKMWFAESRFHQTNEYVALNVCFSFELISVFWINSFITFLMWFGFILLLYCSHIAVTSRHHFRRWFHWEPLLLLFTWNAKRFMATAQCYRLHIQIVRNSLKWPENTERNWIINEFAQKSIANEYFHLAVCSPLQRVFFRKSWVWWASLFVHFNLEVMNLCVFTLSCGACVTASRHEMQNEMKTPI